MKRLIDYDADTLTAVWHDYDESEDKTYIYEEQHVAPILEINNIAQNHDGGHGKGLNEYSRQGIKNSWWHVARIPNSVILHWRKQYGVNLALWGKDDWTTKKIKGLLNSPEWKYLRTGLGRV
ncbi:MAG: hypothetical protein E6Q97_27400 [Desulfurellales bacterium]|nr:MAG: hypothetical protein E6Q97_27400 [Desulfurellales bacterium]